MSEPQRDCTARGEARCQAEGAIRQRLVRPCGGKPKGQGVAATGASSIRLPPGNPEWAVSATPPSARGGEQPKGRPRRANSSLFDTFSNYSAASAAVLKIHSPSREGQRKTRLRLQVH